MNQPFTDKGMDRRKHQDPSDYEGILRLDRNYNNKLTGEYFTTLQLHDPKFRKGKMLKLLLMENGTYRTMGMVRILEARPIRLHQVNEFISYLDAGVGVDAYKEMVHQQFRERTQDVNTAQFVLLLLERVRERQLISPLFG